MQKCYNCGKDVDDNVLICPDCGALVTLIPAHMKRPRSPVRVSESGWTQRESRTSRALCASG